MSSNCRPTTATVARIRRGCCSHKLGSRYSHGFRRNSALGDMPFFERTPVNKQWIGSRVRWREHWRPFPREPLREAQLQFPTRQLWPDLAQPQKLPTYLTRFQTNSAVPAPPDGDELVHFSLSPATMKKR